ncbi:MAG: glucose-6-phosphate isomerase [Rikenellaceae bacterium]
MSSLVKFSSAKVENFVSKETIAAMAPKMEEYNTLLHTGEGKGNDFLGWVNLPSSITADHLNDIEAAAATLRSKAELVIVIGIGGSYLGAKAVLDALSNNFDTLQKERTNPIVVFAGQNISEDYIYELMEVSKNYELGAVIISKSGTTTEPAIAFRIIKEEIEARYGKADAASRIVAVTDASRGALRTLANTEGYTTFVIPDNVGGRFSVLTPVGLLPLAVAGVDVRALVSGATQMEQATDASVKFEDNISAQYAAARTALYQSGKTIEILASYEPKLQNINEWWKQLYGESEGKEGKGIFPASVTYTADLHSMGQYIQEGMRNLFETVITVEKPTNSFTIKANDDNLDGLNFLAGKSLTEVNQSAQAGVMLAHVDGGVPNISVSIEKIDAEHIGALLYFFEKACGMSGYALEVNPFDQPGVEAYKKNMFALLGKPGFEKEGEELRKRL